MKTILKETNDNITGVKIEVSPIEFLIITAALCDLSKNPNRNQLDKQLAERMHSDCIKCFFEDEETLAHNCATCKYGKDKHRYAHFCNECGIGIDNYQPIIKRDK